MFIPETDGCGYLKIKASGEDDSFKVDIELAHDESGKSIPVHPGGKLGPLDVKKDAKSFVHIHLKYPLRCALEVF